MLHQATRWTPFAMCFFAMCGTVYCVAASEWSRSTSDRLGVAYHVGAFRLCTAGGGDDHCSAVTRATQCPTERTECPTQVVQLIYITHGLKALLIIAMVTSAITTALASPTNTSKQLQQCSYALGLHLAVLVALFAVGLETRTRLQAYVDLRHSGSGRAPSTYPSACFWVLVIQIMAYLLTWRLLVRLRQDRTASERQHLVEASSSAMQLPSTSSRFPNKPPPPPPREENQNSSRV